METNKSTEMTTEAATTTTTEAKADITVETDVELRRCKICKVVKPITDFYENPSCRGGHEPSCKECRVKRSNLSKSAKSSVKSQIHFSLRDLSDDILIHEFRRRGFTGELTFAKTITI